PFRPCLPPFDTSSITTAVGSRTARRAVPTESRPCRELSLTLVAGAGEAQHAPHLACIGRVGVRVAVDPPVLLAQVRRRFVEETEEVRAGAVLEVQHVAAHQ